MHSSSRHSKSSAFSSSRIIAVYIQGIIRAFEKRAASACAKNPPMATSDLDAQNLSSRSSHVIGPAVRDR